MVATNLVAASAAAVLVPAFAGPVVSKIPGGAIGVVVLGAAMVYFGGKMDHVGGAIVVGAGAGLLVSSLAPIVLGNRSTVTA